MGVAASAVFVEDMARHGHCACLAPRVTYAYSAILFLRSSLGTLLFPSEHDKVGGREEKKTRDTTVSGEEKE